MRVSFRTTLEQELINKLKYTAKERNINMNDIIEELLYIYYGDETNAVKEYNFISKKPDNYPGDIKDYLKNEITHYVRKLLAINKISTSDEFSRLSMKLSDFIVELAKYDQRDKKIDSSLSD